MLIIFHSSCFFFFQTEITGKLVTFDWAYRTPLSAPGPGQEVIINFTDVSKGQGRYRGGKFGYVLKAWTVTKGNDELTMIAVLGEDGSYAEVDLSRVISRYFKDGTYAGPQER